MKAMRFSPRSRMRIGGPSGVRSSGVIAGIQYSRSRLPIGVPGPTRHISSLSATLSMVNLLQRYVYRWRDYPPRCQGMRLLSVATHWPFP